MAAKKITKKAATKKTGETPQEAKDKVAVPAPIIVQNPIKEQIELMQDIADSHQSMAEAQIEIAKANSQIIEKIGSMSLLSIDSPGATITNCSFVSESPKTNVTGVKVNTSE